VSQYVTPGSALDKDARFRATSVYLPGKLIPMLPKELSAGLCSLHDSVDRLAKSVFMVFDQQGELVRREIVDSVVRVRRFLTYEEVLPVLQEAGNTGDAVVDQLLIAGRKLADALLARRLARGALILEIPRPHVIVDEAGLAKEIFEEKSDAAHNLIEEFMLAANEAVAHFLLERGLPYIGRIHPAPEEDSVEDFYEFCDEMKLPQPDFENPGELQRFLNEVIKKPGGDAVHYALLRSLTRAVYHAGPDLHYALAVKKYVHFTSPIRRYPDTITHQVLSEYFAIGGSLRWERERMTLPWATEDFGLKGKTAAASRAGANPKSKIQNPKSTIPGSKIADFEKWEFSMPHIAAHCTERSIRSDRGELAADQIKILRTLIPRIGEIFHGTVVGVSSQSVTVRLDGNLAEGYVEFSGLTDGWVEAHRFWAHYDTGSGAGRVMLGDRMEVEIAGVDLASRSLRLTPVGHHAMRRTYSRRGDHRDRRQRKNDRRRKRR
jgi:ribonuclease R